MNIICKKTSLQSGGGNPAINYLDERTKTSEIEMQDLRLHCAGVYEGMPTEEAGKLFVEDENAVRLRYKYSHMRMVFSVSDDYLSRVSSLALDNVKVLSHIVMSVMDGFGYGFGSGGRKLRYIFGIHKGTDNLHAHVALLKTTTDGKYISTTSQLPNRKKQDRDREDHFHFFRIDANKISEEIIKRPPFSAVDLDALVALARKVGKDGERFMKAYTLRMQKKLPLVHFIREVREFRRKLFPGGGEDTAAETVGWLPYPARSPRKGATAGAGKANTRVLKKVETKSQEKTKTIAPPAEERGVTMKH